MYIVHCGRKATHSLEWSTTSYKKKLLREIRHVESEK